MNVRHLPLLWLATASCLIRATAAIVVPGADGSDGALNITNNTVIDLSLAPTANWDANNAGKAGKGVYDPSKWAVVFKYSSVSIRSNATVTFKNHASRAPVVWLVSGEVVIEAGSAVDLSGQDSGTTLVATLAEPGPGGFRGGAEYLAFGAGNGPGFGPGGAAGGGYGVDWPGSSAGHGLKSSYWDWRDSLGPLYLGIYGNPSLMPLVGGSGGGGAYSGDKGGGGGAGGGAILIVAQSAIEMGGAIRANGGRGTPRSGPWDGRGNGSGGGIRLVTDNLSGAGTLEAKGGEYWNAGAPGRIRLERVRTDGGIRFNPLTPSVVPLNAGETAQIWMPDTGPSVRIVSIGGVNAPADPRANFGGAGADVSLPQTATVPVVLETTHVEDASKVTVRLMPRANGQLVEKLAVLQQVVSTSPRVIRWTVDLPTSGGYAAIQARVVRP